MSGQNGKGDTRRPGDENAYREGHDRVFGERTPCDICGRGISVGDLISGRATSGANGAWHVSCKTVDKR